MLIDNIAFIISIVDTKEFCYIKNSGFMTKNNLMNQSIRYNVEFEVENNKIIGRKNIKFSNPKITPPKKWAE